MDKKTLFLVSLLVFAACPKPPGPSGYTPPSKSICGNDRKQSNETCDGLDIDDKSCEQLGYGTGILQCKNDCEDFDRSLCAAPSTCGDGRVNGVEICDGDQLNNTLCETLGLGPGVLGCLPNCGDYDISGCAPPPDCGNNEIDGPAEICDGDDLDGLTCSRLGWSSGELRCAHNCLSLDRSGCQGGSDHQVVPDAGLGDGNTPGDSGLPDTREIDGSVPDAWRPDRATYDRYQPDAAVDDAGDLNPSQLIEDVRNALEGAIDMPISGATVTYLKPAVGTEPAGFYIQVDPRGPALFVEVDPVSLSPQPAPGDTVAFRALAKAAPAQQQMVTALTDFVRLASGADIEELRQDVSSASDLVSAVHAYDNELIFLQGMVTRYFEYGGEAHQRAVISTTGLPSNPDISLRLPDSLVASLGPNLQPGCSFSLHGVLDPYYDRAQPSAWRAENITTGTCINGLALTGAGVSAPQTIVAVFSRNVDELSIISVSTQFTLGAGPNFVSAHVVNNRVYLQMDSQLVPNQPYTLTVSITVRDTLGLGVSPTANTAQVLSQELPLVINEVDYDQIDTDYHEFIELKNTGSAAVDLNLAGLFLVFENGNPSRRGEYRRIDLSRAGVLPAGGYLVVANDAVSVNNSATTIRFANDYDNIQNGEPDGVAIYSIYSETVLDALSYEGAIYDAIIDGNSFSLVEGMTPGYIDDASTDSMCRYPDGQDTDSAYDDWSLCSPSPGLGN